MRERQVAPTRALQRMAGVAMLVIAAAALTACGSSARPEPVTAATAERQVTPGGTAAPVADSAGEPVRIDGVEIRQDARETRVEVTGAAPLTWTSFRDAEGRLVVELPNTVPGPRVARLEPATGLVSGVVVERERRANRPLTRLVVTTRGDAEHSVTGDGAELAVRLTPLANGSVAALDYEPLPADEPALIEEPLEEDALADGGTAEELEAEGGRLASFLEEDAGLQAAEAAAARPEPTPAAAVQAGTADAPFVAPPPTGFAASRLAGVALESAGGDTVARVDGDGQFRYSTFALSDPHRFVIDLDGVVNEAAAGSLPGLGGVVSRVRVAQFRGGDSPVSRVVFDLAQPAVPRIERTDAGLIVRFDGNGRGNGLAHRNGNGPGAVPAPGVAERAPAARMLPAAAPQRDVVVTNEPDDVAEDDVEIQVPPPPRRQPPAPAE
ncbi:MAG TPA: AMIN domain-containing protein, partial [Thermoanaerobaculia bacterium]|nr:AMIN domain-containing protein [Thermoanaerobaculia bacterium]